MKGLIKIPLWKKNTIISLFFVTVFYNGCSDVKFEANEEAILGILSSTASVFINENDKYTNNSDVTLSIFAKTADEMMITADPNIETDWEPYSQTKPWKLNKENSQSNVYVKFRSRGIETKGFVTDAIIHDNIAPEVTNTLSPSTWTNQTNADLGFSGKDNLSGIKKYFCSSQLNEEFKPCKNVNALKVNIFLGGLKEGAQFYYVKASDQAGNISEPARARWNIDLTPPTVRFVGSLPTLVNQPGLPINFVGSDQESGIDNYKCKTKTGSWGNCKSPYITNAGTDGVYSLQITATDKAGNTSQISEHNWEVHLSAPVITFKNPLPLNISRNTSTQIGFEGKDKTFTMTQFQCRLNRGSVFNCNSPTSLTNLQHGEQIFTVQGKDRFGQWSREFNYKFFVDIMVNKPRWGSVPGSFTNLSNSQFDILTNDGDIKNYHCSIDGKTWLWCPGGKSPLYSNLEEGPHTLQARVEDNVGNFSEKIYYNWVYDKTPPLLNVVGPEGRSKEVHSYFNIQYSDNISDKSNIKVECNIDNQGFKPCGEHKTYSNLPEGEHTLAVRATDQAQNVTYTPTRKWFVDNSPAKIIVKEQPNAVIFEGDNATILFDIDNDGYPISNLTCKINNSKVDCQPNQPVSINGLVAFKHVFSIEVTDDIGFQVRKDIHFEVKKVGDCNQNNESVCLVLRDNFERNDLFNHSFAWEAFYHDTGDQVNGLEISINNNSPTTEGDRYLNFSGRAGASVHSLYLLTKPFNLSQYNKVTIEFDYLLANLEGWSWRGKSGHEFLKLDICTLGSHECGVTNDKNDAKNKLNDRNRWKNVFTDEAKPNRNKHLNGLNHSKNDFVRVTGNKVTVNLRDLGTNDFSKIMIRLNALMDEGLQSSNPDAVLVDNIKIKAFK